MATGSAGVPDAVPPGTVLHGRYEVRAPISTGAMGAVYRAADREHGDDVAVKRLIDPRQAARFDIEARLLRSLEHPRVVHVRDSFADPVGHFIVMDLVGGPNLAEVLERRGDPGLPLEDVLTWATQTCEALDYVHRQRIVHRDVKPHNLILGAGGVVLVDFGVAREMDLDTGTIGVGTPRMMAPEVVAGGPLSVRSDVYSLAATVWNLLTGAPPGYADRSGLAARFGVPREIEDALKDGLQFMPERRTASVRALAAALEVPIGTGAGAPLVASVEGAQGPTTLMEAIVRTAAGVFDAAAASIALLEQPTGVLVFESAWGAGAREILGVRLAPGQGIAGAVVAGGEPIVVPDCRSDPRFAAQVAAGTGYVPHTLMVIPLRDHGEVVGVLSILDRRDGGAYGPEEIGRAELFADLARVALGSGEDPGAAPR